MSFNIQLIQNNSEPEKIDKDLDTIVTLSGTLRDETSLIDPVIVLEATATQISNCNYLHISQFNRYYFVREIRSIRNGIYEVRCHVDVLRSFRDGIRSNRAIIKRSEKDYELNFDDGSLKVFNNPEITTKSFPQGFITSIEFVLAVAGS